MNFSDINPRDEAEGRMLLRTAFETAPVGEGAARRGAIGRELLRSVRQRSRRVRRMRMLVPAGALLAVGGATALAIAMMSPAPGTVSTPVSAPAKSSALAALTAAVTKTSALPFAFTTTAVEQQSAALGAAGPPIQITGSFDPAHGTGKEWMSLYDPGRYGVPAQSADPILLGQGVESSSAGEPVGSYPESLTARSRVEIMFGNGHMYAQTANQASSMGGKPWLESPVPYTTQPSSWDAQGYDGNEPIAPSALLGLLKSAVSLTDEGSTSGPGWTGTKYGFSTHNRQANRVGPAKQSQITGYTTTTVNYTIEVDKQGLVRDLRSVITVSSQSTRKPNPIPGYAGQPVPTITGTTITTVNTRYSGFGTAVSVTPPPASEIYNFGKQYMFISVY